MTYSNIFAIPDFQCVTNVPTTSVWVTKKSDTDVIIDIIHHNGLKFAPIHSGVITLNDLDYIKEKGEAFAKMGGAFRLKFDLEKCKKHQENNFSCYRSKEMRIEDLDVRGYGFQTHEKVSSLFGSVFREFNFSFYVNTANGRNIRWDMVYDLGSGDCVISQDR